MDIKKRINKISLVLACISILPSFILGFNVAYELNKKESPEWIEYQNDPKAWREKTEKRLKDLTDKNEAVDTEILFGIPPNKYQYPPKWVCFFAGALFAILGFFLVISCIQLITPFIKHGSGKMRVWIVLSILWVVFMYIFIYEYREIIIVRNNFTDLFLSTSPVWIGWAIWWIRKGSAKDDETNDKSDDHLPGLDITNSDNGKTNDSKHI